MVNVEIQTTKDNFFIDRLVAYTSRMYSGQLDRGQNFNQLRPVYSLAFSTVNLNILKGKGHYYHTASIRFDEPPHDRFSRSTRYILVELGKFYGEVKNLLDKKDTWCYLLTNSHKMEDWEFEIIKSKGEDMRHTVERLQKLSADGQTRADVEAFEKQRLKHITENLTAKEDGEKKGIEKGVQKGKIIGLEEGEKKGRDERNKEVALAMLKRGLDIPTICECTGLTEKQIKALKPVTLT